MIRIKQRIFAGATCDQIIMHAFSGEIGNRNPRQNIRFKTEEEREDFNSKRGLRRCIQLINANFTPEGYYITLTFDNENEIYEFEDAKRIREKFRRNLKYKHPDAKFMIFMGRGKNTARIHFHMLYEGDGIEDLLNAWKYGEILSCRQLRAHNIDPETNIDLGADYTALAKYLYDHWTPEQGGHRYLKTKNLIQPEKEPATECKTIYTPEKPPKPPKGFQFIKCTANTQYGYQCFHYVLLQPHEGKPPNMRN